MISVHRIKSIVREAGMSSEDCTTIELLRRFRRALHILERQICPRCHVIIDSRAVPGHACNEIHNDVATSTSVVGNIFMSSLPQYEFQRLISLLRLRRIVQSFVNGRRRTPQVVIDMLPHQDFVKAENDTSCVICIEKIEHGEKVIALSCKHIFHASCISEWLTWGDSCPICKTSVK